MIVYFKRFTGKVIATARLIFIARTNLSLFVILSIVVSSFPLIPNILERKLSGNLLISETTIRFPDSRDKFQWPFSSESIWNMPIGSEAKFVSADIRPAKFFGADEEYYFKVNQADPLRSVYAPGSWSKRCVGSKMYQGKLPIPDNLIVPDAKPPHTPNNTSAFLMPDGRTLVQIGVLARCQKGGPVYGYRLRDADIYGKGIYGAHGGSGLSSFGGSIRRGELIGHQPIRHVLKVNLWATRYYYYSKETPGYRWPAYRADSYAPQKYGGVKPSFVMGSLLAIPPGVSEASLNLKTQPAKKLFHALQDYGAYVVDDSGWSSHVIAIEKGVKREFRQHYGYSLTGWKGKGNPFVRDMMRLFSSLNIIENNEPDHVGGGGQLRAPLAPPIRN